MALVLAACHYSPVETRLIASQETVASPAMQAIDSLMWQRPDSALAVLMDFAASPKADSLDVFNGHYTQLLASELLYKNDYQQSNRAELRQAVAYFDNLVATENDTQKTLHRHCGFDPQSLTRDDLVFLTARAHYINGVGYYERDSVVDACAEYLKVLETMESRFEEKELVGKKAQFMALLYTRLTLLFSDLYLHEQAIFFSQQSLALYRKFDCPDWYIARMLCEIGIHYDMMEQLDSATYYYNRALTSISDTNSLMYRDISACSLMMSYKNKDKSLSQLLLLQKRLQGLICQSESQEELLSRSLAIGEFYYHERLFDSAWLYLDKVYQKSTDVSSKKQAAEWLVEICKAQGKDAEIIEYASFLVPFANQEENQSASKSQLIELYDAFKQKRAELQHQKSIRKSKEQTMIVIGGLLIALLSILAVYVKRKQSFKSQLDAADYTHKMKQKALSGRLKTSNEALRDTLKKLEEQETIREIDDNGKANNPVNGSYESFMQTQICQEIIAMVEELHSDKHKTLKTNSNVKDYKGFALSTTQLTSLSKAIETNFPNLHSTLKTIYPDLDRNE